MARKSPSNSQLLFSDAAARAAETLLPLLGDPDREKLNQLLALSVAETISLAEVLAVLYPELDVVKAQKALGNLKRRINDIAEEHASAFRVMVDTKTRSAPEQRLCWFKGENRDIADVERYSEEITRDVEFTPTIPTRGILTGVKRKVKFFVSYAHDKTGRRVKPDEQLLNDLRTLFRGSRSYDIELWHDGLIDVGENWDRKIKEAIAACDFGLLLISPEFLASAYITGDELPHFVGDTAKPVIPVGLEAVDFQRSDLKGLEATQIFLWQRSKFYTDVRPEQRKKFALELFRKIERRLDEHFASKTSDSAAEVRGTSIDSSGKQEQRSAPQDDDEFPEDDLTPEDTPNFTRTLGHRFTFAESESITASRFHAANARDALTELQAWATDEVGCPFFAVLGEYGIGKTTTLKQCTRRLLELRKTDRKIPLPIYVDLRAFVHNDARGKDYVPTIHELLTTVIERSWKLRDKSITAEVIIRLVREKGAIILFDGLDEKIVHMPPDRAQAFIRTLWSVLPDAADRRKMKAAAGSDTVTCGKLLISCRSHYFRDIGSQNSMLAGEGRENLDRKSFPALLLLPFTEEQILAYLTSFLGSEQRAKEALVTIHSIHNLTDLAQRPYLLSQITERLDELEVLQVRGETVNAARLYELFIKSWLNRDDGKHQIGSAHKRKLMEELAAALWRSEEKQWDADTLEEWLDKFLLAHPEIAGAYLGRDRAVMKEDLRTATFVVRPDDEQNYFRFAHTSLQEFFGCNRRSAV
ncbi:MAG TPA: TIR domain-containing protein [Planctomycetaceae bacterium]|nr:TIR domain-containing protein [Planctomycetaceae bacterium]